MDNRSQKNNILSLVIRNEAELYLAYMPFIQGGGLFIPTDKVYKLETDVFILLTLIDEVDQLPIAGKVVWITPLGAQGRRIAGIGVQFNNEDGVVLAKILTYLLDINDINSPTYTL